MMQFLRRSVQAFAATCLVFTAVLAHPGSGIAVDRQGSGTVAQMPGARGQLVYDVGEGVGQVVRAQESQGLRAGLPFGRRLGWPEQ
ncbi:MAG: hypothetical protein ACR2HJ_06885 [Fimbriimonadales bacterium]